MPSFLRPMCLVHQCARFKVLHSLFLEQQSFLSLYADTQSLNPEWMATIPPVRLKYWTQKKPASSIISLNVSCGRHNLMKLSHNLNSFSHKYWNGLLYSFLRLTFRCIYKKLFLLNVYICHVFYIDDSRASCPLSIFLKLVFRIVYTIKWHLKITKKIKLRHEKKI